MKLMVDNEGFISLKTTKTTYKVQLINCPKCKFEYDVVVSIHTEISTNMVVATAFPPHEYGDFCCPACAARAAFRIANAHRKAAIRNFNKKVKLSQDA
jgi:hypothetical protein